MAIFTSIIEPYKKAYVVAPASFLPLKYVLCIHYQIQFKKNKIKIQALFNFKREMNVIALAYVASLCLKVRLTNIRGYKINSFVFQMFDIDLASFRIDNKLSQSRFFPKTFLIINTNIKAILKMFFLIFSNVDI